LANFLNTMAERAKRHVIEVTAVTRRSDAIFHTIVGGGLEHLLLGAIPREATLLAHLRRSFPNVRDVHLARGGVCRYHLYVQIAKRQEGEAKNIMMGAFAGHYDVPSSIRPPETASGPRWEWMPPNRSMRMK
jgi:2,5-furandicarboxylate decarboxylase 1